MTAAKNNYRCAKIACYIAYITQATVVNLAPLLFVIFREEFGVSFEMLARIVLVNFVIQIIADIASIKLTSFISLKNMAIFAHVSCVAGMLLFSFLPNVLGYYGILISNAIFAFGGGVIEVVVNPIIDSCEESDTKNKSPAAIAILHSFFCWGHMLVVICSTLFLHFFGNASWQMLPILWAIIPFINIFLFAFSRLPESKAHTESFSFKKLIGSKLFLFAAILMIAAGAAEQAVAQWASIFAEKGLGVSKTKGDLLGPMCFALCMAIIRIIVGLLGDKINTSKLLYASSVLCVICYAIMVFVKNPIISLLGCAFCGFAVGFMWPGVLNLSSNKLRGGPAMFGALAFFGDVGCSLGPWVAGVAGDIAASNSALFSKLAFFAGLDESAIGLKFGILVAVIFPIVMLATVSKFKNK